MNGSVIVWGIFVICTGGLLWYWLMIPNITLKVGRMAPEFALYDSEGDLRTLRDFRGKPVVLYFFPKAGTPGCTKQACSLQDKYAAFKEQNIEILGLSYDTPERLAIFKKEHHLSFHLLSDEQKKVAKIYGAARPIVLNIMPHRITFIIDAEGRIAHILPDVAVTTHTDEVLSLIATLKSEVKEGFA